MFSRRCWTRRVIFIVAVGLMTAAVETSHIGAQTPQPASTPAIDLSGNWKLDSQPGVVKIQHLLGSNRVIAIFTPGQQCHNQIWTNLFDTKLKTTPVSGGDAALSLEDAKYISCTADSYMVDACGTAVWESKMREVNVSPDGSMITGRRFYEGLQWDGTANGKYVNCRRDPSRDSWTAFTLTRTCTPDKVKQCRAIAAAMKAISKMIDTGLNSPSPQQWSLLVLQHISTLDAALEELRKQFCDNEALQAKIDKMRESITELGQAQTPAQVVTEKRKLARIDLDLKVISTQTCSVSGPTPPPTTGICGGGIPPKKPGDNEAIDEAIKPINDAIKEAIKELEKYEREVQGGAGTTAGQYVDYWRSKLGQLQKLKGYWDMIRAASCIPPDVINLIKAVIGGRKDMCIDLCWETAKWIEKWYPGPGGDIQKKLFLEGCGFSCP